MPRQRTAKKKEKLLKKEAPRLIQQTTGAKLPKVFFEDEARFGRINNVSRCWVPKNKRAAVKKQIIREHTYVFSAVCPLEGDSYSLITPVCNTEAMNELLHSLSDAYKDEQLLVFADSAGWHRSKELKTPANIQLKLLPPYSPELNPVEHLWDYIREQKGFNNHTFPSMDQLENHLEEILKNLNQEKDYLQSLCTFNWMINSP
ncbi:MAG TPA: IS630 family transposase [Flavisolibacter sp.]|nr:IS630 family transposase [Flavisolibacter sp.]